MAKIVEKIKRITFHEGMLDVKEKIPRDGVSRWIIVDDLMDEANGQTDDLYTKYSHHLNISVFFIVQNLFKKQLRTMSLNTHYLFLFKTRGTARLYLILPDKFTQTNRNL